MDNDISICKVINTEPYITINTDLCYYESGTNEIPAEFDYLGSSFWESGIAVWMYIYSWTYTNDSLEHH